MLEFIIFITSTVGLTLIITTSYLFKKIREYVKSKNQFFGKMIYCSQCMGFWTGILIKLIQLNFINIEIDIILFGFTGSLLSYIIYLLIIPLIKKYD